MGEAEGRGLSEDEQALAALRAENPNWDESEIPPGLAVEGYPHVCADPGACTLPTCNEPPRDLLCIRCGSSGPGAWCSWCKAPVLLAEVRDA